MFQKKAMIGFDLGTHSLKCVLVEPESGWISQIMNREIRPQNLNQPLIQEGTWIRKALALEIMPERQNRDQALDPEELNKSVTSLIKKVSKSIPLNSGVNTAIQGEGLISRYLELPPLLPKELETAVTSKAIKHIPFPLDQVILSFLPVPQVKPGEKKSAVFFVAIQKESVKNFTSLFKKSGLRINRLEAPLLALTQEFFQNHQLPAEQFFVIINVGYKLTQVVIARNGYPYYYREFSLAGRDFTYSFQMGNQSTWAEAEKFKLNYDTLDRDSMIEPYFVRWMNEVKKSLTSFPLQLGDKTITAGEVYLGGGTAAWKNLDSRLAEFLDLPVKIETLDKIKSLEQNTAMCQYQIATGLALKAR